MLSFLPLGGHHRLLVTQTLINVDHGPGVVTLLPAHELLAPGVQLVGIAKLFHLFFYLSLASQLRLVPHPW